MDSWWDSVSVEMETGEFEIIPDGGEYREWPIAIVTAWILWALPTLFVLLASVWLESK